MITYNFQPEFIPDLKSGAKRLTLCRERKHPSRHAGVGEPIGLWTGLRTKAACRHGVGIVEVRAALEIGARGIHSLERYAIQQPVYLVSAQPIDEAIWGASKGYDAGDAFARLDGFENWAAAWAWHDAHRSAPERLAETLTRELIAWRLLSPEAEAALDRGDLRLEDAA